MNIIRFLNIRDNQNLFYMIIIFSAVPAERGSVDFLWADCLYFSAQYRLP